MSFKNINIICKCWEFSPAVLPKDRSIFNDTAEKTLIGGAVDLVDFTIAEGLSPLRFGASENQKDGEVNSLVLLVGDMQLKLSGIKNNRFLQAYFALFDTTGKLALRQYVVDIKYNNTVIFTGYINQDNIIQEFIPARDSEIIEIQILGIEKEFKRYMAGKELPDQVDLFNAGTPMPWHLHPKCEDGGLYAKSLGIQEFIKLITGLDNVTMLSTGMNQWHVNNVPQFFTTQTEPVLNSPAAWWLRGGYLRFQRSGYTVWDIISKTFNSMGWVWYIRNVDDVFVMYGANRSEYNSTIINVAYSDLKQYTIGYQLAKSDIEYIIIKDGYARGPFYHTQGNLFVMITNKFLPVNESRFYGAFRVNSELGGYNLFPWLIGGQKYQYENAFGNKELDWAEFQYILDNQWNDSRSVERKYIKSENIMYVDGGSHDNLSSFVRTGDGLNYQAPELPADPNTNIEYRGNCGSMLFKRSPLDPNSYLMDYNLYSKTGQFRDNFISLLANNNNQTLSATIKGVYTNPSSAMKFTGSGKVFFDESKFAINELEVDLVNETTKIVAVRKAA